MAPGAIYSSNLSPHEVAAQASEVDSSGHGNDMDSPAASGREVFLLHDLPEDLTYRAIHDLVMGTLSASG